MSERMDCGHGCSVTCPDGGGCIYNHSTHECCTFCNGDEDIDCEKGKNGLEKIANDLKEGGKINIKFQDMSLSDLSLLMEKLGVK